MDLYKQSESRIVLDNFGVTHILTYLINVRSVGRSQGSIFGSIVRTNGKEVRVWIGIVQ